MSKPTEAVQPTDVLTALHALGIDLVRDPFAPQADEVDMPYLLAHLVHAVDRLTVEAAGGEDWYGGDGEDAAGEDAYLSGTISAAQITSGVGTVTSAWYLIHANRALLTAQVANVMYGEGQVGRVATQTLRAGAALAMLASIQSDVATEEAGLPYVMPPGYREELAVGSLIQAEKALGEVRELMHGIHSEVFHLLTSESGDGEDPGGADAQRPR